MDILAQYSWCCQNVLAQNLSMLYGYFGRIFLNVVGIFSTTNFVALWIFWPNILGAAKMFWHKIYQCCTDILAGYFWIFCGYLARQVSWLYGYFGTIFSVLSGCFGTKFINAVRIFWQDISRCSTDI
jgi:hypothetical protein